MKGTKRPRAPRAIRPSVKSPSTQPLAPPPAPPPATPTPTPNSIEETQPTTKKLRAKWDDDDDLVMIEVLTAERQPANGPIGPKSATGAHGFKKPTWKRVAERLAGSEKKTINGVVQLSARKTIENCKPRWYVLSNLYANYKYLNGLSGAGWENGCIKLSDEVWAPIIAKQDTKWSMELLQCRDRPFPLFNSIAPLIKGHKATGKYVNSAIVKEPDLGPIATTSTSAIIEDNDENRHSPSSLPSPVASPHSSPHPRSDPFIPPAQSPVLDEGESSADDTTAATRHRKSKVALAALAPIKKKKRSGVEIMDNLSSTMQDFGSTIKSSVTSTSAKIDSAAQSLAEPPSSHAQAVKLAYASDMSCTQRYEAVALFADKPLMAETYVNTPASERNDWLQYLLNKSNEN